MKNKLLLGLVCILSIFLVVGCAATKKALTAEDFENKTKEKGLLVVDVKDQFSQYDFITKATVAVNQEEGWQIEHYELKTLSDAKSMYNKNKSDFEKAKTNKNKETNMEVGNYSKYILETDTEFMLLTRVDETLVYIKTPIENKDKVVEIVKDLGY